MTAAHNTVSFKDTQYEFTAHIRDPESNPLPKGVEDRRMKIYRDLLYNNVEGFISGGFPVCRSIYSDENWQRMVRDFFAHHVSHTPYFLEISQEFLQYLQEERQPQSEDPAGLAELAHYEWVELALSVLDESIDMESIDPNADLLDGHPVLSPLAWPLAYDYPVHRMGPDFLPGEAPDQPTYLVVYRNRNDEVKFMEINPVTARLVHLLQEDENISGNEALNKISEEMQHPNPQVVIDGGLAALQELQQHGIVLGVNKS